jgi:hypothetical protein
MKRRSFLGSMTLVAAGALAQKNGMAAQLPNPAGPATAHESPEHQLKTHEDGSFKILAITDLHHIPEPDHYGIELTEKLISLEKPDLVISTGDNISGDTCSNEEELKRAIGNVAAPLEKMKVPWVVMLGNHDQQHFPKTHISRQDVFKYYESYPHNLNAGWVRGLYGAGNKHMLIWDAAGTKPVLAIWILDSGADALEPKSGYDWIHADQVNWYAQTSKDLESRYGQKIPGLMFFHIPIREFQEMILTKKVLGERHEPEAMSQVNGGLFSAVRERGDIMGIFCGHDHMNNYAGKFHGVMLGYNGITGFRGYPHMPPTDVSNERIRSARVLTISASAPKEFKTWIRFKDGSANWEHSSEAYERSQI